ncbi:MAG: hypothetical protein Tsb0020_42240 [Haliangiales bacterium]
MRRAQQLGRYHLFDRIAFGGMAEIFRAKTFDVDGNPHWVAVKRVLAHLVEDEDFIEMLVDEAKIASQVKHPNIARVYEFTQAHGEYFIAMEHVDGKDLRTMLELCRDADIHLPAHHAAYISAEVASALHAAHCAVDQSGRALHIVHRDVSPSNILCSYAGEVKLCDFGIAKASLSRVQTKTGVIKGKVKYMSPEQALGHRVDHRSDIFSLGVCMYEMLTSRPPFGAANELDMLLRVRDAKYKPVRKLVPEVPPELEAICDRCLSKKLSRRYQSASEVADDLQAVLQKMRPNYSRTQLGRYVRQQFADEIERELRRLEECLLAEVVHSDVGDNLIAPVLGPEAEYSQFSPYPSQVGTEPEAKSQRLAHGADYLPVPDLDADEFDIHAADTLILGRGRGAASDDPRALAATEYPDRDRSEPGDYDEALHSAPTMVIDPLSSRKKNSH